MPICICVLYGLGYMYVSVYVYLDVLIVYEINENF